jgi:hypothetical protein
VTRVVLGSGEDAHLSETLAEGELGRVTLLTPGSALGSSAATWLRAHPTTGLLYVPGATTVVGASTATTASNV